MLHVVCLKSLNLRYDRRKRNKKTTKSWTWTGCSWHDLCICAWPCVVAADKAATRYTWRDAKDASFVDWVFYWVHARPETHVLYACGIAWRIVQSRFHWIWANYVCQSPPPKTCTKTFQSSVLLPTAAFKDIISFVLFQLSFIGCCTLFERSRYSGSKISEGISKDRRRKFT